MEQSKCEEIKLDALDLSRKNVLPEVEKSSVLSPAPVLRPELVGNQNLETKIASLTPEKINESFHITYKDRSEKLPENYKTLTELFNRMKCSLRLLSLRKRLPTFQNICTQVEVLTKRKFSHRHLAQIKYLLPEAVQINKILTHDEETLCMKPDFKITLLFDVVEGHHEESAYIALGQVFASRVLNFFNTEPEVCDIPEAILPVLFNQESQSTIAKALSVDSSMESQSIPIEPELSSDSYQSLRRHFTQMSSAAETEKILLLESSPPLQASKIDCATSQIITSGQQEDSLNSCSKSSIGNPPGQLIYSHCSASILSTFESPLVKHGSVSDSLLIETPAQSTPKRSTPHCVDDLKINCRKPTKRSLVFSHQEGDESGLDSTVDESECCKVINLTGAPGYLQKSSASLSDLVALINRIFKSVNRLSITKEELVHKIIMDNCDVVERREVEEQIELLEKMVPDWISKKLTQSGDLLYNINKELDLDAVCSRLP